jgi:hypothetical protein
MVALPRLTEDGYRILSYRLKDFNPARLVFGECVKVVKLSAAMENRETKVL